MGIESEDKQYSRQWRESLPSVTPRCTGSTKREGDCKQREIISYQVSATGPAGVFTDNQEKSVGLYLKKAADLYFGLCPKEVRHERKTIITVRDMLM